jgi:integrase
MDSVELHFQSVRTDPKNDHLSDEDLYKAEYYDKARHCIWRACRKAFADGAVKLYSLADTRHTFSANRKAKNGLLSTSLELGHSGTTSTKDEYSPASKAWNKYKSKHVETLGSAPIHHQMPSPASKND